MKSEWLALAVGPLVALSLAACSAATDDVEATPPGLDDPDLGQSAQDVEGENPEQAEMFTAALSSEESCDTLPADQTITSGTGVSTTSGMYGSDGCADGYLLDVEDFQEFAAGVGTPANAAFVGCASTPETQEECEGQRAVAFLWRRADDGSTTYLGEAERWGRWDHGSCWAPGINLPGAFADMESGGDYRVAASCRTYSEPHNTEAPSFRQALRLWF